MLEGGCGVGGDRGVRPDNHSMSVALHEKMVLAKNAFAVFLH